MSKTIEYLLIFSAGVAAGVLGARGYFKEKYETLAKEEIDSVKEVYGRRNLRKSRDISEKKDEKPEKVVETVPPRERMMVDFGYSAASKDADNTDYRKFYEQDTNNVDLEEEMAKKESPKENNTPYLISEDDYSDTEISYDKMSCTFYVPDQVLVDDLSREVVEQYVIGPENFEFLVKTNERMVYIRNDELACDLEISRDQNSIEENGDRVWFG